MRASCAEPRNNASPARVSSAVLVGKRSGRDRSMQRSSFRSEANSNGDDASLVRVVNVVHTLER